MQNEPQSQLGTLADNHLRMLCEESGISRELVLQRGYRTISDSRELARLGFAPKQQRTPGLLVPSYATDGSQALNQYRPDSPARDAERAVSFCLR